MTPGEVSSDSALRAPARPAGPAGRRRPVRRRLWVAAALIALLLIGAVWGLIYYHRFYHHVTAQETSHAVEHTTFTAALRDKPVTFQLYQQSGARHQEAVLFTSGDGGWSPFCADMAAHIAATGRTVVGFDAKTYLTAFAQSQRPVTPEELAQDYGELIKITRARPGIDAHLPITLAGWSLGAGYSVLVAADPQIKPQVRRVIAVSLPALNELAWKPTDALIYITHGTPREKVFDARTYLPRVAPVPLFMLNATDDDTSTLADAQSLFERANEPKRLFRIEARGHHFEGGEEGFYRSLDECFEAHSSRVN